MNSDAVVTLFIELGVMLAATLPVGKGLRLRGITLEVFVPLYPMSIGLRTKFAKDFDPLPACVMLPVTSIGKVAGAAGGRAWVDETCASCAQSVSPSAPAARWGSM